VVPALRAEGETVVVFQPGTRPLWELARVLERTGFGSSASLPRRFETDSGVLAEVVDRPLVLVIDQFEELFTLAESDTAVRFSELLVGAVRDAAVPLRVVTTLRADYYDRPLGIPALAGVFAESVVSVKPMTPAEIERAVVEPARLAGASVEPGLLTQLVADMGDQPGALPLLQFTLFELFERTSNGLTLTDYQALGGIQGALTGGADELMADLNADGRDLVEQLMMRMIQRGRTFATARPVPLRELLDLGVERLALQQVLEAFGSRRLLTFDRDASGAAIIEMAHEYLITEWDQLSTWIRDHGEDLDTLRVLDTAVEEWTAADSSPDYLLRGERLARFDGWAGETILRLTRTEQAFIDASRDLREREEQAHQEEAAQRETLARRARRRLWAFGGAVALLAGAVTALIVGFIPEPPPDVVVVFAGRGDGSFGDVIAAGIDSAKEGLGVDILELPDDVSQLEKVEDPVSRGASLVVFGGLNSFHPSTLELVQRHPETPFVVIDCVGKISGPSNLSCINVRNQEIGFLAGVAAAAASETGWVGFVGGVDVPVIHEFQAGFEQGVAFVDPDYVVDVVYLTGWDGFRVDFSGFNSPTLGNLAATYLYAAGSDVVFHAAGFSGGGVFRAAARVSAESESKVWAIGVDVDQSKSLDVIGPLAFPETFEIAVPLLQGHILTSIVKRVDLGIYLATEQVLATGGVGDIDLGIANGGVDYVTTGGHINPWVAQLEAAKEAVVRGDVVIGKIPQGERPLLFELLAG
jgi:basic membrane lipoprotein Med (substrate-binding protein (PBP1-ABC) superfamily)